MSKLAVVIITGLPCTGKTTLARRIGSELSLPVVGRDDIKERLFESLGWKDREWSRMLGRASWDLLYYLVRAGAGSDLLQRRWRVIFSGVTWRQTSSKPLSIPRDVISGPRL